MSIRIDSSNPHSTTLARTMSCTERISLGQAQTSEGAYFGGELLFQRQIAGLTLSEVMYRATRRCRRHTHARAFVALVTDGAYSEVFRGGAFELGRFRAAFHPESMCHADEICRSGTRVLVVEFDRCWIDRLREHDSAAADGPVPFNPTATGTLLQLHRTHTSRRPASPLLIEGLCLELLAALSERREPVDRQPPPWLRRVVDRLHSESGRALQMEEVAADVGRHPVYVAKVFRRHYGQTPTEYLQNLRIQVAARQLADPEVPLLRIAQDAGFYDQSHFTRVFKKVTGTTPGQWRRRASQND